MRARLTASIICLVCLLSSAVVVAQGLPSPAVQGVNLPEGHTRLLLKWEQERIPFKHMRVDSQVSLRFQSPVDLSIPAMLSALSGKVTKVTANEAQTVFVLDMSQPYDVRPFISSSMSGIDLLKPQAPVQSRPNKPVEVAPVKIVDIPDVVDTADTPNVMRLQAQAIRGGGVEVRFKWPESVRYRLLNRQGTVVIEFDESLPPIEAAQPANTKALLKRWSSSVAGGNLVYQLGIEPTAEVQDRREGNDVVLTLLPANDAPKAVASVQGLSNAPRARLKPSPPNRALRQEAAVSQQTAAPERQTIRRPSKSMQVAWDVSADEEEASLILTVGSDSKATISLGDDVLWVVIDKPRNVSEAALNKGRPEFMGYGRVVPHGTATVLKLGNTSGLVPRITKDKEGWSLNFRLKEPETFINPIPVRMHAAGTINASLQFDIKNYGAPIAVPIEDTAERLIAIPYGLPGYGVAKGRRYPAFDLHKGPQGMAIMAHADDVLVQELAGGVRISSEYGLYVSDALPPLQTALTDDYLKTGSWLPARLWRREEDESWDDAHKRLQDAYYLDAETAQDKARAHLHMAQFYLAEGLFAEALGLLELVESMDPDLALSQRVPALKGVALAMMGQLDAANKQFLSPELMHYPEQSLWNKLVRVAKNDWRPELKLTAEESQAIQHYPVAVKQKIAFWFAEKFLQDKQYAKALQALEELRLGGMLEGLEAKTQLFYGDIALATGKITQAVAMWKPLSLRLEDPETRAKAELKLATMQFERQMIDTEEAIDRFEGLRMMWRGDEIEEETLRRLGQLYVDSGQFIEGLRVWRELVTNFPDSERSKKIAGRMEDVFVKLFNRGGMEGKEPLEALSTYYEFRELTPLGKEGDLMIQNLADRLVEVDLLTRAAALLTHQVRFRLRGEERAKVGTRLALIHLMNQLPEEALNALQATELEALPLELAKTRSYLRAEALSRTDKHDEAIQGILPDRSMEAEQLKIDIAWRKKDWPEAVAFLERVMARTPIEEALDDLAAQRILQLVIAYRNMNDFVGLNDARRTYRELMQDHRFYPAFDILTKELVDINHLNVSDATQITTDFRSFLGDLEDMVKRDGLSNTVAADDEPA